MDKEFGNILFNSMLVGYGHALCKFIYRLMKLIILVVPECMDLVFSGDFMSIIRLFQMRLPYFLKIEPDFDCLETKRTHTHTWLKIALKRADIKRTTVALTLIVH